MTERDPDSFENQMNQLAQLLKKMMKNLPPLPAHPEHPSLQKECGFNLNLFLFTVMPVTPEEMDEFEQATENYVSRQAREEDSSPVPLHPSDVEFLRRHGIQF